MYRDDFTETSDEELGAFMKGNGFIAHKRLEDGEVVGLLPLMTTLSVCSGVERLTCFKYRWCFKDPNEARKFFSEIKEYDEIPTSTETLVGHRYGSREPLMMKYDHLGFKRW